MFAKGEDIFNTVKVHNFNVVLAFHLYLHLIENI